MLFAMVGWKYDDPKAAKYHKHFVGRGHFIVWVRNLNGLDTETIAPQLPYWSVWYHTQGVEIGRKTWVYLLTDRVPVNE